jgi:hypothetical protein
MQRERRGSPFDWFDWIEFSLTWQVNEQDETYREKKKRGRERERTRNRSAICQHQSSPVVTYIWVCIERTERTKLEFAKQPIIYNRRGGNRFYKIWHLSFCLTYTKIQLIMIYLVLFHFSILYAIASMVSTEQ